MTEKYEEIKIPDGFDIYWEPWVDAYNEDLDLDDMQDQEEYNDLNFEDMGMEQKFMKPIKTLMTPFGMLPLTEQSLAGKYFKFWVGHTNFPILNKHVNIIQNCLGVESVDVFTPYRFRIAVGVLFQDRDVMHNLKNTLLEIVNGSQNRRDSQL